MKTLELDKTGRRAPDDLAGLRNQVRMIANALEAGDTREAGLQLDGLLDDLLSSSVRFSWRGPADAKRDRKQQAAGIAAYCLANPAMVD